MVINRAGKVVEVVVKLDVPGLMIGIVDRIVVSGRLLHCNKEMGIKSNHQSHDTLAAATAVARVSGTVAAAVAGILIAAATSTAAGVPAAALVRAEAPIAGRTAATTA